VAVVLRGMGEGFFRQIETGGIAQGAAVGLHFVDQTGVIGRIGDDGDVFVVFCRGTHHRRAADVDVLDGVVQRVRLRHGLHERIEVDADQVDVTQLMLVHGRHMRVVVAHCQDAGVDLGMQRLDAAIEHFRKAGEFRDILDRQPRIADRLGSTAGGQQFDTLRGQRTGKVDQAGFIGDGEEGAFDHDSVG
jgi:hypothetical protein